MWREGAAPTRGQSRQSRNGQGAAAGVANHDSRAMARARRQVRGRACDACAWGASARPQHDRAGAATAWPRTSRAPQPDAAAPAWRAVRCAVASAHLCKKERVATMKRYPRPAPTSTRSLASGSGVQRPSSASETDAARHIPAAAQLEKAMLRGVTARHERSGSAPRPVVNAVSCAHGGASGERCARARARKRQTGALSALARARPIGVHR